MARKGYSLVSQQIRGAILGGHIKVPERNLSLHSQNIPREKIKRGFFSNGKLEKRIQPSSFEPSLADEVFIIDTRDYGLPRPTVNQSVYRMILERPLRTRTRKSLEGGFEIKSGFTYLIKLNEKLGPIPGVTYVRSSPKSSTGRLFPKTRFLADYNPCFDDISIIEKEMDLWLVVQPLPINLIAYPNLTLNQLRFFSGDARLSDEELKEVYKKTPLLYEKNPDGKSKPISLTPERIVDGLNIWIDTEGRDTHGVFGLRARRNPDPVDMSKVNFYSPEDYFEPMVVGGKNTIKKDHYLFSSKEILFVPPRLSSELKRHSRTSIEGRTHDAGFADPGFFGPMVGEVSSEEETDIEIAHMPLSALEFFRNFTIPDKIYGEGISSNYQGQIGPKTSKHFKAFDFESAARNHDRLSRIVLVQDSNLLHHFRNVREGFEPIDGKKAKELLGVLEQGFFHSRYDCEDDPSTLQAIPYVIIFNKKGGVFSYIRTLHKKDFGEKKLLGKHSIGLGGHVTKEDGPDYINRGLEREVFEEEVTFKGETTHPQLVGTLFSKDKSVDQVHFGLIYTMLSQGDVIPKEKSIEWGEFVPIQKLIEEGYVGAETETWSRILIPHLKTLYGGYIKK